MGPRYVLRRNFANAAGVGTSPPIRCIFRAVLSGEETRKRHRSTREHGVIIRKRRKGGRGEDEKRETRGGQWDYNVRRRSPVPDLLIDARPKAKGETQKRHDSDGRPCHGPSKLRKKKKEKKKAEGSSESGRRERERAKGTEKEQKEPS